MRVVCIPLLRIKDRWNCCISIFNISIALTRFKFAFKKNILSAAVDVMDGNVEAQFMCPKQRDRISNIPDSLLFHILSFLKMEDVVKTTVLSRRWRYLWTTISDLNFQASQEMINRTNYESFVDRALIAYKGSKIMKFRLSYFYRPDSNAFQVDSWILFVVGHNVEEFVLDFICGLSCVPAELENYNSLYKLHSSCFNCASLTKLTLRFCSLSIPTSMCLSSLKVLSLEVLELSHDTIKRLTSGCPVLEELLLSDCNWRSDLNICIPELPLQSLKLEEFNMIDSYMDTAVEIYAPNLRSVEFITRLQRSKYHVKGPSSLVNVRFDLCGDNKTRDENGGNALGKLLEDLHCVVNLRIDGWSLQVLAAREVQNLPIRPLNATSLELVTALSEWELPGMSYMLKSCPYLETLIISGEGCQVAKFTADFKNKYDDIWRHWQFEEHDFSSTLQNVKTIKLLLFSEEEYDSSFPNEAEAMEELFKEHRVKIALMRLLLQSCKGLLRMTITRPPYNPWAGEPLDLPHKFSQYLVNLPRASPAAELIFV